MTYIKTHLPLILLIIAAVMLLIFTAYSLLRDDEEEEDEEEGLGSTMAMSGSHAADTGELAETDDMRARKSRMIALKDSLEKSLQTRGGVKASGLDRLAMPWFMLVGTETSGKKALLASTGLPLPYGPPVEVDSARKDAGRWWLFEDAVVVEAPTAKPAPKAVAPSEVTAAEPQIVLDVSEGWNNLLHLLRRERPDSPLNGIIVALSAADLVGTRRKTPEEITEQAEVIRAFLDKTRRVLGVRLPMHLLISKCDVIPGFRSFAETLPDARRDDIFGWANPAPLEKPFDAAAVDAGFLELRKSLETLHDELLAAPETVHDADGLFVFVSEFAEIQDPLRDFVTKLMPQGERRPSLFFRGVYFTGDASEFAARAASRANDETATLHISIEATEAESHSLVFLRSLFKDKIFKEAGLARSAAALEISRDRRVVVAQAAAILITLLGGLGLWSSINGNSLSNRLFGRGLRAEATDLRRAASGLLIDVDELKRPVQGVGRDTVFSRQAKDRAVVSLVSEMRSMSAGRVRSPFVPSSWFSPLPAEIDQSVVSAVQEAVLPLTRLRLQERVNRLMGNSPGSSAFDDLDPSDPASLTDYLRDVRALSRNIARYNTLANKDSGTVQDLSGLLDYLFAQRPGDSLAASSKFQNALKDAASPPLVVTPAQTNNVVARAVRLIAIISDSAVRQLASRSPTARPENDLDALYRLKRLADLTDSKTGLVATVSDSTILGVRVAHAVEDSVGVYLSQAASRVLRDTLSAAGARQRLQSVLTGLYAMRLLEPSVGRMIDDDLRAGKSLRWDVGQLELALALRSEQLRATITTTEAFPAWTAARLKTAFGTQMQARMIDLAASGQRYLADSSNSQTIIRIETENLEAAAPRLVKLARVLDTLKAGDEGRKLLAAGTRQAEHVLALSQAILDSANFLAPHPIVVAAWRGGLPIGHAAVGVLDSAEMYVRVNNEQLPRLNDLVKKAMPAVKFLRQPIITTSMIRSPKLLADWSAMAASIDKMDATDFSSTAFALRDYVMLTMGALDVASCQAAASRPDTLKPGSDWFVGRRRQYRATLIGRCGPATGSAEAIAAYDKLRGVFTTRLAGHYPFVDTSRAASAPDADPAAVREFYALYDAFAKYHDPLLRSDPRVGPGARPAFIFLDEVAQARPFFAPFIDSAAARRAPEYSFVLSAAGAPNGTAATLTGAVLQTGERSMLIDENVREGVWGFGEPVKVVRRATDSIPARTTFASTGWWGLVELAGLQKDVVVRLYHPDTKIPLTLPNFPKVAPPIPPRGISR